MRCLSCLEAETVICCHCGRRLWIDENTGSSNVPLCDRCYDNHYTCCTNCDRVLHRDNAYYDDDEPYCHDCYTRHNDTRSIHDYYYKPTPIFYGESERYFGIELEVDGAGECDDCAYNVICTANMNELEHIYCKHGGSLDEGFEIVTHPMALDYHTKEMPWAKLFYIYSKPKLEIVLQTPNKCAIILPTISRKASIKWKTLSIGYLKDVEGKVILEATDTKKTLIMDGVGKPNKYLTLNLLLSYKHRG